MSRILTDHIVSGDQAVQLRIEVMDDPGAGGANHRYEITGFDIGKNVSYTAVCEGEPADYDGPEDHVDIFFQNGPIKESGVNGITQEALLAIVIDRLRSFQAGPFACQQNGDAQTHCELALGLLQERTVARIKRGVEGTNQK